MKGILIKPKSNENNNLFLDYQTEKDLTGKIVINDKIEITRILNNKFAEDKLFYEDQEIVIVIDGILLNAKELKNKYSSKSNSDLIKQLFKSHGADFFKILRGDLSLILFDKSKNRLLIYTNIIGTKPIYYYNNQGENDIYASSNPLMLIKSLKKDNKKLTPNTNAFHVSAAYSYLLGDMFFASEIKKLEPGSYLDIDLKEGKRTLKSYFKLSSYPQCNLGFEESVDKLEELFSHSIQLQFDKDNEYNYKHLSTLSGGLDSRMTTLVAAEKGYISDTLTFSSKGYWDEIIAKGISSEYGLKNTCLNIASGKYLKNFERSFEIDAGAVAFHLANQMFDLYNKVDFSNYGLVHSGQLGDVVLGKNYCITDFHTKYTPFYPSYKKNYIEIIEPVLISEMEKHKTMEITRFYNQGFNFISKGDLIVNEYSESASPFTFQEVLEFGLSLPIKFRKNHKLYFRWIEKYHQTAGSFFYENTKIRTLPYSKNRYLNKSNHIFNHISFQFKGLKTKNNQLLNFKKWGDSEEINQYFDNSFYRTSDFIEDITLRSSLIFQYENGSFNQKLSAYSAAKTYHKIFIER